MLTVAKITTEVTTHIKEILGDELEDDDPVAEDVLLVDLGLNSLMLARLIVALEREFGFDPFFDGRHAVIDIHTVGELVAAYSGAAGEQDR